MSNARAWTVPAVVASLLAIGGLGYAHFRLEGVAWVIRVALSSIWRIFAVNLAVPLLHAGMELLPVAAVALLIAGVAGEKHISRT